MRLPRPFYRLPIRFDVERLRAEVAALPESAWAKHPNHIAGNSAVRLISVEGGENDDVNGVMRATPHLAQSHYLRQVLASFGVVWSRSRLLRLAPGAGVPEHADINYHWFNRVRLHIPLVTRPEVRFYCGDQNVHMAAGEAWLFDNWRLHRVENPTPDSRVHLVADTSGSAAFWQFVAQGEAPIQQHRFDSARDVWPLMERATLAPVMTPGEVDLLLLDLRAELVSQHETAEGRERLMRYHGLLDAFSRDWRQLYALHGGDAAPHGATAGPLPGSEAAGWSELAKLRDGVRDASRALADGGTERIVVRTNRVSAHAVLEARLLRPMLSGGFAGPSTAAPPRTPAARLEEPVFIIAAPRSGSTLLFETLAVSDGLYTLGGEGHELIEGIAELQPGAQGVDSNRLTAEQATDDIATRIVAQMLSQARDARGQPPPNDSSIRFLEKTPKNALRIPFINRIFPTARFIVLWRDPRENLASIIEAWRSGRWKTYNGLPGFEGPWSLLLPPGWPAMNSRPLEDIAAFQWDQTYRIVLDDLAALPRDRWTTVNYGQLTQDTAATIRRLCEFTGIAFDGALAEHLTRPLPLSRYTLTPPDPQKWRRNEGPITRVLPAVTDTWYRLAALSRPDS